MGRRPSQQTTDKRPLRIFQANVGKEPASHESKRRDPEELGPALLAKDTFRKIVRTQSAFQPPPLQVGDKIFETQEDKANALRKATLERLDAGDDIEDPWTPLTTEVPELPFSIQVSAEEAEDVTTKTGNTSPGTDNATTAIIRACWPIIGGYIRWLYERCLCLGHHPTVFKGAEVIMIPKPGKRDLSSPRTWRPISLLSYLSKGLERLVARHLAFIAIDRKVLYKNQAGALTKRSAVDLVAALIHDIESALARGLVVTLVTMDIQGAFDTVLRNRLLQRLRQQGWPELLVRWVASFMTGHIARVHFQDVVTPLSALECGLPQGSPVSPILFLLYTEPIYKIQIKALPYPGFRPITTIQYGYANDITSIHIGRTLRETTEEAGINIEEIERWGSNNEISFDPGKTEIIHFSRRHSSPSPSINHKGQTKTPKGALRWLAQAITNLLQGIANTARGPPPDKIRLAIKAPGQKPIYKTRLQRTALLLPPSPRPHLLQRNYSPIQLHIQPKDVTIPAFLAWTETLAAIDLIVYSDRSRSSGGAADYGYVIHRNSHNIGEGLGRLGPAEVFDAEIAGTLAGLRHATGLTSSEPGTRIYVYLDNTSTAAGLLGQPSESSQAQFLEFQSIARAHGATSVRWSPGHKGIPGNKQANKLAKAGTELPEPPGLPPSLAFNKRKARALPRTLFKNWWQDHAPESYQSYQLEAKTSSPAELQLPRKQLRHLLAARSGHGDFAKYHERFVHEAELNCSCRQRKSPDHPFYCRKIDRRQDFGEFITMIEAAHFFQEICPHHR
ncbi:hypothetical protein G7Z17_g10620 [Cylindrodendrum hubeiense]|uniref:Reverse transcriptase n=1 Tax=Cylindrodendrum hubeiense TaxID=595255 RepID=A0A9P5L4M9_9HYPO|nr:hypothetical protein G7Z17_g10620 [Cylindrodendrum hubeiense]